MSPDAGDRPRLIVLAGSNGAGKSTFFELYLEGTGIRFVNADLIARVISSEDPQGASYAAAQAAELERRTLVAERESFCMETVLSDPAGAKLGFLREAQGAGYLVHPCSSGSNRSSSRRRASSSASPRAATTSPPTS